MINYPTLTDDPAIPAATVITFRRNPAGGPAEILMAVRSAEMRVFAGAAVFPGGRIDPADHELAARHWPDADPEETAARLAGIREMLEEAGLLLAVTTPVTAQEVAAARQALCAGDTLGTVLDRFGWQLDLDRLVPWARWNPKFVRAFDTRFYLADLGTGAVTLEVDGTEHTELLWITPAEALARVDRGEMRAIYPTLRNLERLALHGDFAAARAHANIHPIRTITPRIEVRDDGPWLTIPDDLGYPITGQKLDETLRA